MAVTQYKPYRLTKKVGERKFRQLIPASYDTFEYVSLGDSICAGHAIDGAWYKNYGVGVQYNHQDIYGNNRGNCLTTLLPNTYTALLQKELQRAMPNKKVNATSFGHSGATVDDLIDMLREGTKVSQAAGKINTTKTYYYGDNPMTEALRKADLVTISIGANAFLSPGMSYVENSIAEYLYSGTSANGFKELENVFNKAVSTLGNEGASSGHISVLGKTYSYTYSFLDLIETLYLVNPNAIYRFTSIHNPFRCFYLDDRFIRSFFNWFWDWVANLLSTAIEETIEWKTVQSNAGYLSPWVGGYIDQMNQKLNDAATRFTYGNFAMTPVKELFDAVPDRLGAGEIKYNDLINLQVTRGFTGMELNWGALWKNPELGTDGVQSYVEKFVLPYLSSWDLMTMLSTIVGHMTKYELNYIMDPHPRNAGHEIIYRIFSDSVSDLYGTTKLNKITYKPNGGTGTEFVQKYVGSLSNKKQVATITRRNSFGPQSGYRFIGWSISSGEKSPTIPNASEQILSEDVSLHGQWSNQCIIKFKHTNNTGTYGATNEWITENFGWADWSGHSQCYGLWVNDIEMPDLPGFDDNNRVRETFYSVPYGSWITVNVKDFTGDSIAGLVYNRSDCHVYLNGNDQSYEGSRQDLWYGFTITCDMEIDFKWQVEGSLLTANAQSWENCHMTTFDASYSALNQPYTITFNPGGGSGNMTTQKVLQFSSNAVKTTLPPLNYSPPDNTYRFTGWSTGHSDKQLITMSNSLVLTAQWNNNRTIVFTKSLNDWGRTYFATLGGGITSNTGKQIYKCQYQDSSGNWQDIGECYGYFGDSNNKEVGRKDLPYGTNIRVNVKHTRGGQQDIPLVGTIYEYAYTDCYVYIYETINGSLVHTNTIKGGEVSYNFPLTQNTIIDFWYDITNTPWTGGHLKWDASISQLGG